MIETGLDASVDEYGNIVLKNISGYNLSINPAKEMEVEQFLLDFNAVLHQLPLNILKLLEQKSNKTANLHLEVKHLKGIVEAQNLFALRLTNLAKTTSYFNEPFFKIFPAFKVDDGKEYDSFLMHQTPKTAVEFPYELKFGEPVDLEYQLQLLELYKEINSPDAFIQAFVSNTLGELLSSRAYPISSLLAICEPSKEGTKASIFKRFFKK